MPRKNQCVMSKVSDGKRCNCNICKQMDLRNRQYCYFHYNYIYGKQTKYIQYTFRSNKIRNAMNIYKLLPIDLQNKVKFYVHENYLIKKHQYNVIQKIILNRREYISTVRSSFNIYGVSNQNVNKDYFNKIYQIMDLIIKYKDILSYNTHSLLSIELGKIDKETFNYVFVHLWPDFENEMNIATPKLNNFCINMNKSLTKTPESARIHRLYCDNIIHYSRCLYTTHQLY